jgi:hypothetical protein
MGSASTAEVEFRPGYTMPMEPASGPEDSVASVQTSTAKIFPATVAADGAATATVTVAVKNAAGLAVPGKAVTLVSSRGVTDTIAGPNPATTNAAGETSFTIRSSTAGYPTLTANVPSDSLTLIRVGQIGFLAAPSVTDFQAKFSNALVATIWETLTVAWKNLAASAVTYDGTLVNYTSVARPSYAALVLADRPLGYWRLGETYGTIAADASGNGRSGVYLNGPSLGAAHAGDWTDPDTAATFDGSNDYLSVPNSADLNSLAQLTLEVWIYPTVAPPASGGSIVQKSVTAAGVAHADPYQIYNLGLSNSRTINFGVSTGAAGSRVLVTSATTVPLNAWSHVVATYDGTTSRIYIDGVLDANTATPALAIGSTPHDLRIGGFVSSTTPGMFTGRIDEVALYGTALSAAQIASHFGAKDSAWAGAGGNRHPAALALDGATQYANLTSGANSETNFSFETWIKPSAPAGGQKVILANGETTDSGTAAESSRGLTLKQSKEGWGRVELSVGEKSYSDEVLADAPVAYWRLGEPSGTLAYDSSGNSRHGTYVGAVPGTVHDGTWGSNDTAATFDGTNDYVSLPAFTTGVTSLNDFTVSMWVKMIAHNASNRSYLLDFRGDGATANDSIGMIIDRVGATTELHHYSRWASAGAAEMKIVIPSPIGQWVHLAYSRQGTTLTAHVNGVAQTSAFAVGAVMKADAVSLANAKRIGTYSSAGAGNYWTNAIIDDVAIFNTALSDTRLLAHYHAGLKRLTCETHSSLAANAWHHIAGAFDASGPTLNLWIDGVSHCSKTLAGAVYAGSANDLKAGRDGSAANSWSGQVSEVRTYGTALTTTQVRTNLTTTGLARFPAADVLPVLNGLKVWLKADELKGYVSGNPIHRWTDQSGNRMHAHQVTPANRPVYRTGASGINGRPAVEFTAASGHYLRLHPSLATGDKAVFFVLRPTRAATSLSYLFDSPTGRFILAQVINGGGFTNLGFYTSGSWKTIAAGTTAAQLLSFVFEGVTGTVYRNGTSIGSGTPGNTAISGTSILGGAISPSGAYDGLISEFLIYDGTLSAADRTAIEAYLNAKYGLY